MSADVTRLDFLKLVLYLSFFCVLCMFYGMPIHIIRDVALTIRSFYKRINDFIRYRQATRDMNARYPDATSEEVAREDVCIICREDMIPWRPQNTIDPQQGHNPTIDGSVPSPTDERLRPKKLPCGHILHFACLRSWLERQQNCPTCRRPVLLTGNVPRRLEMINEHGRNHDLPNQPQPHNPVHEDHQQPVVAQNIFNLGPLRITFGARRGLQEVPQPLNQTQPAPNLQSSVPTGLQAPQVANAFGVQHQVTGMHNLMVANNSTANLQSQLLEIEHQLTRDIYGLRLQQSQVQLVRALQSELARLRVVHASPELGVWESTPQSLHFGPVSTPPLRPQDLVSSHSDLPPGMTIPPGWTLLPLRRLPHHAGSGFGTTGDAGTVQSQSPQQNRSESTVTAQIDTSNKLTDPISNLERHSNLPRFVSNNDPNPQHQAAETAPPSQKQANYDRNSNAASQQRPGTVNYASGLQPLGGRRPQLGNGENSGSDALSTRIETSSQEKTISHSSTNNDHTKGKGKATSVEEVTEDTT